MALQLLEKSKCTSCRVYPLLGTLLSSFRNPMSDLDVINIKKFGDTYGAYVGRKPELITADLDVIKAITIKDFNHFVDRRNLVLAGKSKIAKYFLTVIEGDEWKAHRSVLTPTFTSGKLRQMGALMEECTHQLNQLVRKSIEDGHSEMDMKEKCGSYTMNVISSCCFGYKIDSQNPDDPFLLYAKQVFSQSFSIKGLIALMMPKVFEYFEISIFPEKAFEYFEKIVNQVVGMRKEDKKKRRNDFLDLLLDAEKDGFADEAKSGENDLEHYDIASELKDDGNTENGKKEKVLNSEAVVAHSTLFLLAGYETTAATISFVLYYMALNPECQDKLVQEINETIQKHEKLSYDTVGEMLYLDKVVSETLRINPPAIRTERRCTKPYILNGIEIKQDMIIGIPIYGIHHDERYYPNPNKFDPERFSPENKAQRNPMAYIPFGVGPRNCVGMRFALIEAKMAIANFLREFQVSPCSKTEIPLKMQIGNGLLKPVNGVQLKVSKRKSI